MAISPGPIRRRFLKTFGFDKTPARDRPVVGEDEVFALLEYAARQGIPPCQHP